MHRGIALLFVVAGMGPVGAQEQFVSVETPKPNSCPVLTGDGSTVFWSSSKIFRLGMEEKVPTEIGAVGVFLDVSPDGEFLGTSKGEIWNLKAKKKIKTLDLKFLGPVAFSDDGKLFIGVVVNDSGNAAYGLFDVPSFAKKLVVDFERPNAVLTKIVNGRFAVSGADGRVAVFDTAGKALFREKIHDKPIVGLALVNKSKTLVSSTFESRLSMLDLDTKNQEFFEPHDGDTVENLAASLDGKRIATSARDEIKIWETPGLKLAMTIPTKGEFMNGLAFSVDGKKLAVATGNTTTSGKGKIIIFDVKGK